MDAAGVIDGDLAALLRLYFRSLWCVVGFSRFRFSQGLRRNSPSVFFHRLDCLQYSDPGDLCALWLDNVSAGAPSQWRCSGGVAGGVGLRFQSLYADPRDRPSQLSQRRVDAALCALPDPPFANAREALGLGRRTLSIANGVLRILLSYLPDIIHRFLSGMAISMRSARALELDLSHSFRTDGRWCCGGFCTDPVGALWYGAEQLHIWWVGGGARRPTWGRIY